MIGYHASPRSMRHQILIEGLSGHTGARRVKDPNAPQGNYLFASVDNARHFATIWSQLDREEYGSDDYEYDIWTVCAHGIETYIDPTATEEARQEFGYPAPLVSVYTTDHITYDRLVLMENDG